MNLTTLSFTATLALAAAVVCSAQQYACDLKSGPMSAGFNCGGDGLSVSYNGVSLIRDSTIWVHNPAWTFHYYGLPHLQDPVKVSDIDGGKMAEITHRSEWFHGDEKIIVKNNSVTVELKYKLIKQVEDADMEYCFGNICAAPILGCPFKAVTVNGESKEGTIAVRATSSELAKTLVVPESVKKLEIDSRIGKITLEASGDPKGIAVFDNRMSPYEAADRAPVFWSGILGTDLEFNKNYTYTITLTVDPTTAKTAETAEPSTKAGCVIENDDLRAPSSGPVYVIPEPQEMTFSKEDFPFDENTVIVVGDSIYPEDYRGAKSFAEETKLLYGFEPKIITESEAKDVRSAIYVGEAAINKTLADAAKEEGITAPGKEEGYALKVTPKRVLVLGHDRVGSYYGMQTLKQLVKVFPHKFSIQGCAINDWPSLKFRGAHLFTGNQALPFHKKLIDRIFSRFKMNSLVLEVDQIKWKSDPELAVNFSEDQEDVKKEIAYAKAHFIEITPLLQSLGHSDWMFTNGKNRDLAEYPERPYSYCPTNPRIYPYVFKFYDEVIDLFDHPKYIHIGHDEVVEPGGFPKHEECKKRTAEQIFVDDTLKVREHLKKQGANIMMWGDMMLYKGDDPDAMNAKSAENAKWIRDQLPKDVIVTDWHYAPGKPEEFKSLDIFKQEGLQAIASTWFTPENIEGFSKQAKNVGSLGLLQTTWAGFNSNENNLKENFVQFSAMILAAEYAWNSGKTSLENLPYKWDEEFRKQWDPRPIDRTARRGFMVDLSSVYDTSLADNAEKTGWLGLGAEHDLSAVPTGEVRFAGDLFKMTSDVTKPSAVRLASSLDEDKAYPDKVMITLNKKAGALVFIHTCQWTDRSGRNIGAYKIHYADGSTVDVLLNYGVDISSWTDQRSVNGAIRVWEGRTKDGQKVALQKLQWDNPNPDKEIKSIEFTSAKTEAGPVLLALSGIE